MNKGTPCLFSLFSEMAVEVSNFGNVGVPVVTDMSRDGSLAPLNVMGSAVGTSRFLLYFFSVSRKRTARPGVRRPLQCRSLTS
jgi:hypothetical protein